MALVVICDRKTMKVKSRFDDGIKKDPDWDRFTEMAAEDMESFFSKETSVKNAGGDPSNTDKK